MAFPLDPSQLRALQRAFCLATSENDYDSTKKVIKPLTLGLFYESCNAKYFKGYRPLSPPIPVDLPETSSSGTASTVRKRQSFRATNRNGNLRRKSRMSTMGKSAKSKEPISEASSRRDTFKFQGESLPAETLETFKEKKKAAPKQNPLTKLFVKRDKTKLEKSDSQSTILQVSLNHDKGSFDHASYSVPAADRFYNYYESEAVSAPDSLTDDDEEDISDDIGMLDNRDASNSGFDEDESLDSAFTDIECDSMIDGSPNMMYDYSVPETSVLRGDAEIKKNRHEKQEDSVYSKKGLDSESTDLGKFTPILGKRQSFTFPKISGVASQKPTEVKSKLSMIIHTRHTSSNANPLNYFSYSGADCAEGVRNAEVSVFVPPNTSPTIEKLLIVGNMSVFDCIGYILLKLSVKADDNGPKEFNYDPNHWRLELTDEDGELYDANFGVLDRTREMASYNFPKYLALCKVDKEAEIRNNEKQSPLPIEFKQNLALYEELSRNIKEIENGSANTTENWDLAVPSGKTIEVKVKNVPSTSKVISFFVDSGMLVGDLLDLICRQYQVDPTNFKLSGFQALPQTNVRDASLLTDKCKQEKGQNIPLKNTQILSEIHVDFFKVDHLMGNTIRPMLEVKAGGNSYQESSITPKASVFIQADITPPVAHLEGRIHDLALSSIKEGKGVEVRGGLKVHVAQLSKTPKKTAMQPSASSIDLLTTGKNAQFPTSLNTFYCKWRVFRKKAPLINRIEKSLIIDGDYIHLAPTDDANRKTNSYDNSFLATSQSGHHHHYLHHYNYSKYYNDTILKTSSFHISQIVKLKQYKESKNPMHFKIVVKKEGEPGEKETMVKKKYDLEAETLAQCDEIFEKIKWALQLYNASNATQRESN